MPLMFRLAIPSDAPAVAAIYTPIVEQTSISFELTPPSIEELAQRIVATAEHYPWLVCERDGEVAGYAYASQHRTRAAYQWAVDVSAYIHPQWRKRGIGRGLYGALLGVLRAQNFYAAYAGIALPNQASVALHESVGFRPLGIYRAVGYKLGTWHDVGWWQYEIQPRASEPSTPLPIKQIVGGAAWQAALAAGEAVIQPPE